MYNNIPEYILTPMGVVSLKMLPAVYVVSSMCSLVQSLCYIMRYETYRLGCCQGKAIHGGGHIIKEDFLGNAHASILGR